MPTVKPIRLSANPDHAERLQAARAWSAWMLGDPSWADVILDAYENPAATNERLDDEGADRLAGADL